MTLCSLAWAQTATIIKGRLTDQANKEAIAGASVLLQGTTTGTVTDLSGAFQIKTTKTGNATVVLSYIGYTAVSKPVVLGGSTIDLGEVALAPDAIGLSEVEVIASVAIDRKTPVAVSTIKPEIITEKLGTKEFPDLLKSTPGVYTTRQGGGWGDGRISIRGFSNAYNAVMINGIPVNDMEGGTVYWSNWAGLSDVTSSMQVQRGLGAARIAVPSLGGTINIITKTTDAKAGGSAYLGVGNNGYFKQGLTLSTGLRKGWAVTLSGSHTAGNGWVNQTAFEGWSYFLNVTKQFNKNHTLAFTAFGAPQEHEQRSTSLTQALWDKAGNDRRFNSDWGMMNGEKKAARVNFYHKPQISLTHYWNVNEKLDVTTSAYVSIGRGGGQRMNTGALYTADGLMDYDAMIAANKALAAQGKAGKYALISSMNEHNWYGVVSNANYKINEHFTFTGGIDGRYYQGLHYQRMEDNLGGLGLSYKKNGVNTLSVNKGDYFSYNNDGIVRWLSGNAQLEYSKDKVSAFVTASLSHQGYQRIDYFTYEDPKARTEEWTSFTGYTLKGGVNYNITDKHNVFANVGYFERPPFFNSVYATFNNDVNKNAENEKVLSSELGYGFRSKYFSASANTYYSMFNDRSMVSTRTVNGVNYYYNMQGVDALHYGFELDMEARPVKGLTIKGMLSLGDWTWQNNVDKVQAYDNNQNPLLNADGTPAVKQVYLKGVHVGDVAQTTAALGVNYEIIPGLKIGADLNYYDNLYASFSPADRDKVEEGVDAWKTPSYYLMDMNASYKLPLGKYSLTFYGNVDNLLDETYISDAYENRNSVNASDAAFFYGMGRTWSAGMKFQF